jgi:hypothetical protein
MQSLASANRDQSGATRRSPRDHLEFGHDLPFKRG